MEFSGLWGGVEGVMLICLICPVEQQWSRVTGTKPTVRKTKCFLLFSSLLMSTLHTSW